MEEREEREERGLDTWKDEILEGPPDEILDGFGELRGTSARCDLLDDPFASFINLNSSRSASKMTGSRSVGGNEGLDELLFSCAPEELKLSLNLFGSTMKYSPAAYSASFKGSEEG